MKRKTLPFGLLALFVVLSLAAMGVAYALWSDTLTISGTVNTGSVDMKFVSVSTNDPPPGNNDPGYEKDVANCVAATSEGNLGQGSIDTGPDAITVTINNGYPSYTCTVTFKIENAGSIPVNVQSITPTIPSQLEVIQNCVSKGQQLDPGDQVDCELKIHVLQGADENTTYYFSKQYEFVQWNEYTP